jgi:hypothetical protein
MQNNSFLIGKMIFKPKLFFSFYNFKELKFLKITQNNSVKNFKLKKILKCPLKFELFTQKLKVN